MKTEAVHWDGWKSTKKFFHRKSKKIGKKVKCNESINKGKIHRQRAELRALHLNKRKPEIAFEVSSNYHCLNLIALFLLLLFQIGMLISRIRQCALWLFAISVDALCTCFYICSGLFAFFHPFSWAHHVDLKASPRYLVHYIPIIDFNCVLLFTKHYLIKPFALIYDCFAFSICNGAAESAPTPFV